MSVDDYLKEVLSKFAQTEQGDAINRLANCVNEPCAENFLKELKESITGIGDTGELVRRFIEIAEQHIGDDTMTIDDARQLIQQNISSGFVDPRTHEQTCRKVVTNYQEHPEEQDVIGQALVEVVSEYDWAAASAEQLENAAYLAVNLESLEVLQSIVMSVANLDEPSDDFVTVAIAAIRSFPGNGTVRSLFFPALFRWLRCESVAHLAFEALCELTPDDAGAYFSALSHYHRGNPDVIQKALTHLYYRGGDTDRGTSDVRSVVESFTALVDSIKIHPFLPDTFKSDVEDAIRKAAEKLSQKVSPPIVFVRISQETMVKCRKARDVIAEHGMWGGSTR